MRPERGRENSLYFLRFPVIHHHLDAHVGLF